ncbi:MAG: DUF21 domain-containing protein [Lentisphaerae bacterium]|nr:DUF21 domain-containing protein [Lentisphaerota bacterium]
MNGWKYIEEVSLMLTLLIILAFCSAAETSYSAADHQKIRKMGEAKRFGAKLAGKLLMRFDDALSAILIANTIVCIALSPVGAIVFGDMRSRQGSSHAIAEFSTVQPTPNPGSRESFNIFPNSPGKQT